MDTATDTKQPKPAQAFTTAASSELARLARDPNEGDYVDSALQKLEVVSVTNETVNYKLIDKRSKIGEFRAMNATRGQWQYMVDDWANREVLLTITFQNTNSSRHAYMYDDLADYEETVGYKVNESFANGFRMARMKWGPIIDKVKSDGGEIIFENPALSRGVIDL